MATTICLAQNTYNELSQLTNKKVGGISASNPLQSIDYAYNIRGWMTKVNDPDNLGNDLFGYAMKYNNPENTSLSTGRFNGNIAEIDWRTSTVANDNKRRYSFMYTALTGLGRASTQSRDHQWSIKIIIMNSSPMT